MRVRCRLLRASVAWVALLLAAPVSGADEEEAD